MRKLPPLHALRAFEAAARHLHFTKAAEELGLTPTAISHQVRLLEDLLGSQLFIRQPRPIRLTPEGERLFPVLRDALDSVAHAIEDMAAAASDEPLTISMPHSFASRWFVPRMLQMTEETGLEVVIDASDAMVELHARTVDAAIRYPSEPPRGVVAHRIFPDRMVPICVPALAKGIRKPSDLLSKPLIHYKWKTSRRDAPSWSRWLLEAQHIEPEAASVALPRGLQVSEEAHAIDAALAGQGIALASDVEVSADVEAGRLAHPLDIAIPGLTFYLVHLRGHRRSADLERLAEWIARSA